MLNGKRKRFRQASTSASIDKLRARYYDNVQVARIVSSIICVGALASLQFSFFIRLSLSPQGRSSGIFSEHAVSRESKHCRSRFPVSGTVLEATRLMIISDKEQLLQGFSCLTEVLRMLERVTQK
jgi:hypothetical protein